MATWLAKQIVTRNTGNGTIGVTYTPQSHVNIEAVRLTFGTAASTAGNLTATISSGTNAVYNHVLVSEAMSASKDYTTTLLGPIAKGDALVVAYPDTHTAAKTWGLTIHTSQIEGV